MDKEKLKKLRRSDFFKAVFLIIFVFVTGWVIFGFTRVYGSAMKPAACDGDILMYYRLHTEYKAGDMVVYQADGLLHIGRIAAVPEETVQITDEGELVINGYTQADTEVFYEKGPANGTEEQSLGKGEYYILADDPSSTEDSRSYGPILRKQIKGIVVTLIRRRNR